jgi:AcrR family transcriptional regulator
MAHVSADTRREQFIEAAVRVIAREGVDGATTRKIAQEAQAPLASLHYCFQTKEKLLFAVFESLSQEFYVDADAAVIEADNASLGCVVEQLMTLVGQAITEKPGKARATLEIAMWASRNDPELGGRLYDIFLTSWEGVLRKAHVTLSDEELRSVVRVIAAVSDGFTLQMSAAADRDRLMRDTATACAMLKAFLDEGVRGAA